ncbi:terminase small subunit [Falsiroseomonas selenitidurans]|uniref:Terminase small subunit n=1 Tax=Falsiroseomonas selenitidurans TaxID=2716335 RepID=A0ABX1E0L5_9PROT|nr:terminase small subunit [Falsiroseomonas selenitidurans]NKC30195.1 terminase small subunit [Falsiroseomonas selenitidurans]
MLTEKQSRFVEAYLLDPNGKKAAIAAGYAASSAEVTASKLLRHPKVAAELSRRRAIVEASTGVTIESIVLELAKIGFADIRKVVAWRSHVPQMVEDPETNEPKLQVVNEVRFIDSADIDDATAGAIAEITQTAEGTLKVKLHDKPGALVKLGQHLGMFRPPSAPSTEKPGKKAAANMAAQDAEKDTDWDGLIN